MQKLEAGTVWERG